MKAMARRADVLLFVASSFRKGEEKAIDKANNPLLVVEEEDYDDDDDFFPRSSMLPTLHTSSPRMTSMACIGC